ncbi:DUF1918 domain-containing protein [Rhodococcus maanshanensis]|uniref:DUF1918 domain-containing protein n=1 Tax=Rhodococcus maanshanensis TaxID=183556 RepID=UPI0022B3DB48|nr:DUF1918 domain-containing protein [Rhodococcus maanshanensis]MCZ4558744.1 DUF1918 domain-containing protein [Rhodococcus maanshanensis]
MRAQAGDWLVVKGTVVDAPDQVGQIVEVRTRDGGPPYVVKWVRDGHQALVFPGPDALVVSATEMSRRQEHERERIAKLQRLIGETAAQGGEIT